MRFSFPAIKSKIKHTDIGSNCPERCVICDGPCVGGPPRFLYLHTCLDLHQWVTPPPDVRRP